MSEIIFAAAVVRPSGLRDSKPLRTMRHPDSPALRTTRAGFTKPPANSAPSRLPVSPGNRYSALAAAVAADVAMDPSVSPKRTGMVLALSIIRLSRVPTPEPTNRRLVIAAP